jgi:phosphocarrier protein
LTKSQIYDILYIEGEKNMRYTVIQVKAPNGLSTRHISNLVVAANNFKSDIKFRVDSDTADMKSIMNMLALLVQYNTIVNIEINGEDEDAANKHILEVFQKFQLV